MKDVKHSITINAPVTKVWDTMLEDETYRIWTAEFNPGSYYKGSWEEGSEILFAGPNPETGEEGGMYGVIAENTLHKFVSIKLLGEFSNNKKKAYDQEPAMFENYSFTDNGDSTELAIEVLNVPDEYFGMFDDLWPKALEKLKEITQ